MKKKLIIIQPTPFCNINCSYCYLPDRSSNKRMSPETLKHIFTKLLSSALIGDEISCLWHAGEPLVLPIDFYRQAFELQQQYNVRGVKISNAFQTNGTLITQKWCDFFREQQVNIGVSIDGPQYLHDAHRVDRKQRGTFDQVMQGIALLQTNTIRYNVISVVTSDTTQDPDGFWNFFKAQNLGRLGLNPEEVEGINVASSLNTAEGIKQYEQFFKRLVDLNAEQEPSFSIREIDFLKRCIQISPKHCFSSSHTPAAILSFDYRGNFSTFSPELLSYSHALYGDFFFGNVYQDELEDLFHHPKFIKINAEIQSGIAKCRKSCDYFELCGGGSPSNKLHENGSFDSTETSFCRMHIKIPTDVLLEHFEEQYAISSSINVTTNVNVKEEIELL